MFRKTMILLHHYEVYFYKPTDCEEVYQSGCVIIQSLPGLEEGQGDESEKRVLDK